MATKELPSPDTLRQLLRYEPETGKLFWLERQQDFFPSLRAYRAWNSRFAGRPALACADGRGYLNGSVLSCHLLAHRVVWAMWHGEWPQQEIDHINCDRSDNRVTNLRDASPSQNMCNKILRNRTNKSGSYRGVRWNASSQKWYARIKLNGREKHLGTFNSAEAAYAAYCDASAELHGEFGRVT